MFKKLLLLLVLAAGCAPAERPPSVIVVGAGVAGLSAAVEASQRGGSVTVVDRWSVFGGHAVISGGSVCIVDTPVQREAGIEDSAELALADFLSWGGDEVEREWARYYAEHSRREIYDWLTPMEVEFHGVGAWFGNSVARLHRTRDYGLGLVSPLYRRAANHPRVRFVWNFRVDRLLQDGGRVAGVSGVSERNSERREYRADAVILATGGFQSNLDLVREFWPRPLPLPERILAGSGLHSTGSGLELAQEAGAGLQRLDRQWNYSTGLPHPSYPGSGRGLSAGNSRSLWINREGRRFVDEQASEKFRLPRVLAQPGSTYWAVFDSDDRRFFNVSGAGWEDFEKREALILSNPALAVRAATLRELARQIYVPTEALEQTVGRFNRQLAAGRDPDFGRFDSGRPRAWRVDRPPFFAVRVYPLARKSMGGVRVDLDCRVLDAAGTPIPGLLAAGEVTGLGGLNGSAPLEGTFLGPSIVMGRVAARTAVGEPAAPAPPAFETSNPQPQLRTVPDSACTSCHPVAAQAAAARPGYRHFELSHREALERHWECSRCHATLSPYRKDDHRWHTEERIASCRACHLSAE